MTRVQWLLPRGADSASEPCASWVAGSPRHSQSSGSSSAMPAPSDYGLGALFCAGQLPERTALAFLATPGVVGAAGGAELRRLRGDPGVGSALPSEQGLGPGLPGKETKPGSRGLPGSAPSWHQGAARSAGVKFEEQASKPDF